MACIFFLTKLYINKFSPHFWLVWLWWLCVKTWTFYLARCIKFQGTLSLLSWGSAGIRGRRLNMPVPSTIKAAISVEDLQSSTNKSGLESKLSCTISCSWAASCVSHAWLKYLGPTSALCHHDHVHKESEASNTAVAKPLTWHHRGRKHRDIHVHSLQWKPALERICHINISLRTTPDSSS